MNDIGNQVCYLLNNDDQTAVVGYSSSAKGDILIPKFVEVESIEYTIIGIQNQAFINNNSIHSVSFADDSEVQFIGQNVFCNSSIQSFSIPASLKQIPEGWCCDVRKLTKLSVSPSNPNFEYYDNKILISKRDNEEIIIFANRNIREIVIPSKVTRIGEFSFSDCFKLLSIQFSNDPQIRSISKNAFLYSSLNEFFIPESVVEIEEGWCHETRKLVNLHISQNNENFSYLEKKILISKNKNKFVLFARRDIQNALIPSDIKKIGNCAFEHCHCLSSFRFENHPLIEEIGVRSFLSCWFLNDLHFIPKGVKKIGEYAFYSCKKLGYLCFEPGNEIKKFNSNSFGWCFNLFSITSIPESLVEIDTRSFLSCVSLVSLEFLGEDIKLVSETFNNCTHLSIISLPDAQLVTIKMFVFTRCSNNLTLFVHHNAAIVQIGESYRWFMCPS
ncbi:hypothetical protein M9Y10_001237 [Tritrichomonas musculus]|uniref:Surface antigen BspA-like n=1 Tax=Tritrichomonas musculus TaxID=1915356 RepID=A0ABR2L6G5_9EUKA